MVLFGKAYEFNMATCPRNYYSLQRKKVGGNIRVWSRYENIGRRQSKRLIIRHITPTLKKTLIAYRNRTGKYFLFFLWIKELLCYMHTSKDGFEFSRDSKLWSIRTLHPWNNVIVVHHKLMWSFTLVWSSINTLCDHRSAEHQVPPASGKRKTKLLARFLFEMWSGRDVSWFPVSYTDTFLVIPNFLFQLLTPEVMNSQANESLKFSEKPSQSSVLCGWWQN